MCVWERGGGECGLQFQSKVLFLCAKCTAHEMEEYIIAGCVSVFG